VFLLDAVAYSSGSLSSSALSVSITRAPTIGVLLRQPPHGGEGQL
jgi:hypothetical protein